MVTNAGLSKPTWRQWTVQLPATLATAACLFLGTIGWLFVEMLSGYNCALNDGPPPAGCSGAEQWWVPAGGLAQWGFAAAVITLGIRSRRRPSSRQSGAIACWLMIPVAVGWFVLCVRLSGW